MMTTLPQTLAEAEALDQADAVGRPQAFALPVGVTYLVGHSLGPASHSALARVQETAARDWAQGLVRSWNSAGWMDLAAVAGGRIAALIGAQSSEVIVTDSVSVNLFKLGAAALSLVRTREIAVEADEFPTDVYVAESLGRQVGAPVRLLEAGQGFHALEQGCVLIKSVANYRTAALADMAAYEAGALAGGGVIVWDLSHATGGIAVDLAATGARLAAGCGYKYLNGGPGAPGFVFVAESIADRLCNPIAGWFGHASPFAFSQTYEPLPGAARFACGTPPILSLAALEASLVAFEGVDPSALGAKTFALGELALARAAAMRLRVMTPPVRGAHVSLQHTDGYAIVQAMAECGVLADFRTPDTIRLGLSPLYVSFAQVWRAFDILTDVLESDRHNAPRFAVQAKVT